MGDEDCGERGELCSFSASEFVTGDTEFSEIHFRLAGSEIDPRDLKYGDGFAAAVFHNTKAVEDC